MKTKVKEYSIYFMLYAILGWIYEVFLEVVVYGWGFTNRGVLFGPYTPVYGVGALLFILSLYPWVKKMTLKKKVLYALPVFLACALLATLLELGTSYLLEWIMGSWPWQTYADYSYHFQARIALSPSLRFGLGGLVFLYFIQPTFEALVRGFSNKTLNTVFYFILLILTMDMVYTFLIA